jgi:galactonate dehydratase
MNPHRGSTPQTYLQLFTNIESGETPDHYLPYWRELSTAGIRCKYYMLLVEVGSDDGLVGWGESLVREVPTAHAEIVEKLLAPIIVGQDSLSIEELW